MVLSTFILFSSHVDFCARRAKREVAFFREYPHMNHSAELPLEKKVRSGRGSLNITFFNCFFLSYPVIKMCFKKECACLFFQTGENNFEESTWHYKGELEKQFSNQLIWFMIYVTLYQQRGQNGTLFLNWTSGFWHN